ncbi:hypothetical protein M6B38_391800 [Iris pallida]|uniref:Uncharacterized protein n=1 Tax=Iris pallida TaxID=29817 RepID=A0AAX6FZ46_IRIPA|nr:hypothetical protein M6B38_391800 [Iris pallida]
MMKVATILLLGMIMVSSCSAMADQPQAQDVAQSMEEVMGNRGDGGTQRMIPLPEYNNYPKNPPNNKNQAAGGGKK